MTNRRGFTLIELMVSLALFGLIASGAMMLVTTALRMQAHSARVDVAQSALRAGLDFMTRDLLSASAGASSGVIYVGGAPVMTIQALDNYNGKGPDAIELYLADSSYDFATVYGNVSSGSSSISVDITAPFVPSGSQYQMLSDLTNAVQIYVGSLAAPSGTPSQGTLDLFAPVGTSGAPGGAFNATSSWVFVLKHVRYSVDDCWGSTVASTQYANQKCLMVDYFDKAGAPGTSNPQPLAEGVEDLQIAYGFDSNGDGNIVDGGSTSDEWIGNNAGDTWFTSLANLKAIRVTIVAISTMNENVQGAPYNRPAIEDHAASAFDGFFRRILRTQVSPRNFNL